MNPHVRACPDAAELVDMGVSAQVNILPAAKRCRGVNPRVALNVHPVERRNVIVDEIAGLASEFPEKIERKDVSDDLEEIAASDLVSRFHYALPFEQNIR